MGCKNQRRVYIENVQHSIFYQITCEIGIWHSWRGFCFFSCLFCFSLFSFTPPTPSQSLKTSSLKKPPKYLGDPSLKKILKGNKPDILCRLSLISYWFFPHFKSISFKSISPAPLTLIQVTAKTEMRKENSYYPSLQK